MRASSHVVSRLLFFLVLTVCVSSTLAAGSEPAAANPVSGLKAEDLLAAGLGPEDIRQKFPHPDSWWPFFPEFNTGLSEKHPGERFLVVQNYQLAASDAKGRVENALILSEDEKSASETFDALVKEDMVKSKQVEGPALGDETRYLVRTEEGEPAPYVATVRFRIGPISVRLTTYNQKENDKPENLAAYASPVVEKVRALLKGEFQATPIPEEIANRLPGAPEGVGPIMGSAIASIDSWALTDTGSDPPKTRDRLSDLGVRELGLRRFAVSADPNQIVDIVLFMFPDEKAATEWFQEFFNQKDSGKVLSGGNMGDRSLFIQRPVPPDEGKYGTIYELQFAKGRYVGDVVCYAPFGTTSPACEHAARLLGESWFTGLQ